MSVFDSPIARCDAVHEMVLTDETQAECAREHECPPGRICPLDTYFVTPGDATRPPPEGNELCARLMNDLQRWQEHRVRH